MNIRHPREQTGVGQPVEQVRADEAAAGFVREGVQAAHDLGGGNRLLGIVKICAAVVRNGDGEPVGRFLCRSGRLCFGGRFRLGLRLLARRRLDGGRGAEHGGKLGRQGIRPVCRLRLRGSRGRGRRGFGRGRLRFRDAGGGIRDDLIQDLRNIGKAARHTGVPRQIALRHRRAVYGIDALRQFLHVHLCAFYGIKFGHALSPFSADLPAAFMLLSYHRAPRLRKRFQRIKQPGHKSVVLPRSRFAETGTPAQQRA